MTNHWMLAYQPARLSTQGLAARARFEIAFRSQNEFRTLKRPLDFHQIDAMQAAFRNDLTDHCDTFRFAQLTSGATS